MSTAPIAGAGLPEPRLEIFSAMRLASGSPPRRMPTRTNAGAAPPPPRRRPRSTIAAAMRVNDNATGEGSRSASLTSAAVTSGSASWLELLEIRLEDRDAGDVARGFDDGVAGERLGDHRGDHEIRVGQAARHGGIDGVAPDISDAVQPG